MMGRWQGPDNTDALLNIWRELDPDARIAASDFINTITRSGLLVRKPYYVPDPDELLGLMHELQYKMRQDNGGCRWVMCRETFDAIANRYRNQLTPVPAWWASTWTFNADSTPEDMSMNAVTVIDPARTTLCGMPVRIDPAARSPLFEIDNDATRTAP